MLQTDTTLEVKQGVIIVTSAPEEDNAESKEVESEEVFADPTYDVTFKMLFANEDNKDIVISLLNNLLDFTGDKEIQDVTIMATDLQKESASGVKGSVDVLCMTKAKKQIAIEMQRQYKPYFLARAQEYMSKMIANQVKSGQSELYDEAVLDTYILAIGKQNIFRGDYKIKGKDKYFEKTVVPVILETMEEIPGNKMHWKFFELPRFNTVCKKEHISPTSSVKLQWLDFLRHCEKAKNIPDNIDSIIKKGYNIMKIAKWSDEQRVLYWKQKADERSERLEIEREKIEKFNEGIEKGKLEAIKQILPTLKKYIFKKHSHEDNVEDFPLLQENQITTIEKHVLTEHQDCDCNADALSKLLGLGSALQFDAYDSDSE